MSNSCKVTQWQTLEPPHVKSTAYHLSLSPPHTSHVVCSSPPNTLQIPRLMDVSVAHLHVTEIWASFYCEALKLQCPNSTISYHIHILQCKQQKAIFSIFQLPWHFSFYVLLAVSSAFLFLFFF